MARTSAKSTYSLDVETARKLDCLAARWQVAKSEALGGAIELAARDPASEVTAPLHALQELQRRVNGRFSRREIERWAAENRRERVATSARKEWRKP